jgi:hypothetical protein
MGTEALIALGATVVAAIIKAIMAETGMTREEAVLALTKDMSDTQVDQAAAEKKEREILEGKSA